MKVRSLWVVVVMTFLTGGMVANHFAFAGTKVQVGRPCNEADAAKLDEQLTLNGKRFFGQVTNFRADGGSHTVYTSELLKWYGTDFAPTPAEQARILRPYFPSSDNLGWLDNGGVKVKYLNYDWGLNDQATTR